MTWKNRKVFITGADGFIGSHLAEALVARGAEVTALALYNSFDSLGWRIRTDTFQTIQPPNRLRHVNIVCKIVGVAGDSVSQPLRRRWSFGMTLTVQGHVAGTSCTLTGAPLTLLQQAPQWS